MRETRSRSGAPENAPSRSTRWSQEAPSAAEALRSGDRIAALDGHSLAAALREANDAALEHVDRRVDREFFAS